MEADETIGILGCRIVNAFTRRIDQWIYHQPSARFHRSTFDTYSFSAAGAMVRTEAVMAAAEWLDLSNSESPELIGLVVAALSRDETLMQRSGASRTATGLTSRARKCRLTKHVA